MPRKLLIIIVIVCWTVIYARQSQVNPLMHDVAIFKLNMQHTFTVRISSGHMGEIENWKMWKNEKYYKIPARIGLGSCDMRARAIPHCAMALDGTLDSFQSRISETQLFRPRQGPDTNYAVLVRVAQRISFERGLFSVFLSFSLLLARSSLSLELCFTFSIVYLLTYYVCITYLNWIRREQYNSVE